MLTVQLLNRLLVHTCPSGFKIGCFVTQMPWPIGILKYMYLTLVRKNGDSVISMFA